MIYTLCKNVINSGNYEHQSMQNKLDVYLLGNRITTAQYTELTKLMEERRVVEQETE